MSIDKKLYRFWLDVGSISVKCIITDAAGKIVFSHYERTAGQPVRKSLVLFRAIEASFGTMIFSGAVVTGSGKELVAESTGIETINEIVAHATAAWKSYPDIKSIFEIGGQDSKYITIGRDNAGRHYLKNHAFNQLCAAGTGAFLDQQAEKNRLIHRAAGSYGQGRRESGKCGRQVFGFCQIGHDPSAAESGTCRRDCCRALLRSCPKLSHHPLQGQNSRPADTVSGGEWRLMSALSTPSGKYCILARTICLFR
jgi:hypothetical protein